MDSHLLGLIRLALSKLEKADKLPEEVKTLASAVGSGAADSPSTLEETGEV